VDQRRIDALVEEAVRELSPDVVRIRHNFGEDWSGDPAIFFRVVLADEAAAPSRLFETTTKVIEAIRSRVDADDLGVLDYFNFRSESEQAKLKDRLWD